MEAESFESEETAAIMNKHFINIKVDREERPDVDRVYVRGPFACERAAGAFSLVGLLLLQGVWGRCLQTVLYSTVQYITVVWDRVPTSPLASEPRA
jgi:hypothetical protein